MHGGADQPCSHPLPMLESGLPYQVFRLASFNDQDTQVRAPTPTDRIANKLPALKGRILHRNGYLTFFKMTLCVVPVYTSININLPGWLIKAIQKVLKYFLWLGSEVMQNNKCIVTWRRVQRPLHLDGLGVLDLQLFGIALWVCWLRLHRFDPAQSWASLPLCEGATTVVFFNASIQMTLGNDEALFFWTDPWL
jgi:hypothetical protein